MDKTVADQRNGEKSYLGTLGLIYFYTQRGSVADLLLLPTLQHQHTGANVRLQ